MLGTGYSFATEIDYISGARCTLTTSSTMYWSGAKEKADWELTSM